MTRTTGQAYNRHSKSAAYDAAQGDTLADEEVVKLLQEIRDLQKLHIENYKDAVKNQQESIAIQKRAVKRQKISLLVLFVLLAIFLFFVAWWLYR